MALASKEDLAGEMIYSQNCYDALTRAFSWKKLDECGGFDTEASLALGDGESPGADKEVAWFDTEAAAGRYLKAAVAAGLDTGAADLRLSSLQAKVGVSHKPKHQVVPEKVAPVANPFDQFDPTEEDNSAADV